MSDVLAIASGVAHVAVLRRDGSVLAWGSNANGQLGDGTLQDSSQPHSVLGPGGTGQLNLLQPAPANFNRLPQVQVRLNVTSGPAPLLVQATASNASDPDGTIASYSWRTSDGQQATGAAASFAFAQPGTYQVVALVRDNAGGVGTARDQVAVTPSAAAVSATAKVAIGVKTGFALANNGRVLAWGDKSTLGLYDASVQNALPDANSRPIANGITGAVDLAIFSNTAYALQADGTVLGWGNNGFGKVGSVSALPHIAQPKLVADLPAARALAAGQEHTLALTRDGRVFAWGGNTYGQLGLGDIQTRFQPVEVSGLNGVSAIAAGNQFSAVLKSDGTVWAWGDNAGYQLGDGTQTIRNRPVQVPSLSGITKIFAIQSYLLAQRADGTVWVTGNLPVAIPSDPGPRSGPRRVPTFDGYVQFAGSYNFLAALKADGTVWSGGQRASLLLGIAGSGDIAGLRQIPNITDAISLGYGPTNCMAIRRDGTVYSWGLNNLGQVGDGTLAYRETPVLVIDETATNFLDLIPEVPNVIPRDKIPPFLLSTFANGDLSSTTLYADLRGIIPSGSFASATDSGKFAAGYNVYVAANVPTIPVSPYFQLNANNSWATLSWPMAEFLRGVALDSQTSLVRAQILQNVDLSSPVLAGSSIIVGYGTDPDEMLRSARYRTIFTVPQP
jgi:alpha-tubulin suppressor-like RCC1 family protein